jgi:hypothetical protein
MPWLCFHPHHWHRELFSYMLDGPIFGMGRHFLAVGIETGYGAGRPRGHSSSSGRVKNVFFSTSSRPALGSTQPPVQWVPAAFFTGGRAAWA